MRKRVLTGVVLLALCLGCTSCEQALLFGGGVAGAETFQSWQENLEAKKVELQEQYDAAFAALEQAPDAAAVQAANEKLQAIQNQQTANAAALLTVEAVLQYPKSRDGPGAQKEFWASVLIGGGALAVQHLSGRKTARRYKGMQGAQRKLEHLQPDAGKVFYDEVGKQFAARGVA